MALNHIFQHSLQLEQPVLTKIWPKGCVQKRCVHVLKRESLDFVFLFLQKTQRDGRRKRREKEKHRRKGRNQQFFFFLLLISEVLLTVQITHLGDRRPMRCKEPGLDIHMEKK